MLVLAQGQVDYGGGIVPGVISSEITCLIDIIGCLVGLGSIGCDANQIQFSQRSFIGGG